ncbi:TetR/AcrR family transcriptional regulator [Catenulispora sp. GP43]|uniref:TetR/AcrR family transcriptional regulator n=1 Tax=Catenulispora sp. GP43 TaxID=3156263 RepID=UPI003511C405
MARWEPNAQRRLQQAAGALFAERGYADVTVADIAERAGLTKRTFFNHFPDKREVLFADAAAFEASVLKHLAAADPASEPLAAAVEALTSAGLSDLAQYGEYAAARRELIASSIDLQERDLIKTASLTAAIAAGLLERGVPPRTATFAGKAAVAVFTAAYDDWIDAPTADFSALMRQELAELRRAVCG